MEKKLTSNIFFNLIKTFMGIVFPFVSFPYAARILGADNLGMVQYSSSLIAYFALFAELGIGVYATREGSRYRDDRRKLSIFVKEIIAINIITSFIVYLCLGSLIVIGLLSEYKTLLLIYSMTILFTTFKMDWLYQIVEDFKYISIRSFLFQVISLIFLFIFVRERTDYIPYAVVTIFASGGNFIFNLIHSRKYVDWSVNINKKDIFIHIKPVIIIFGITAAAQIYLNLDAVMIGVIRGTEEVGLYSASIKLVNAFKTMFASISIAILARLSLYANMKSKASFFDLLIKTVNFVLMLIIPLIFGIVILRNEILYYLYGNEYKQSSFALSILTINMFFSVIDGFFYHQICLPMNKEKKACIATIIGAALNFALNIVFIKLYGFNGGAITTLISEIIVFFVLTFFLKIEVPLKLLFIDLKQYLISSVAMGMVIFVLKSLCNSNIFLLILISLMAVLIYGFMLIFLKNDYFRSIIDTVLKKK